MHRSLCMPCQFSCLKLGLVTARPRETAAGRTAAWNPAATWYPATWPPPLGPDVLNVPHPLLPSDVPPCLASCDPAFAPPLEEQFWVGGGTRKRFSVFRARPPPPGRQHPRRVADSMFQAWTRRRSTSLGSWTSDAVVLQVLEPRRRSTSLGSWTSDAVVLQVLERVEQRRLECIDASVYPVAASFYMHHRRSRLILPLSLRLGRRETCRRRRST